MIPIQTWMFQQDNNRYHTSRWSARIEMYFFLLLSTATVFPEMFNDNTSWKVWTFKDVKGFTVKTPRKQIMLQTKKNESDRGWLQKLDCVFAGCDAVWKSGERGKKSNGKWKKREGWEGNGCRWRGLWKRSREGDEILPYLSRQLHFVDFYLQLRGDMWDLLGLAFNWLSICQQFSPFRPFLKVPGEVWEYWLPLHEECKDGFQIECKEPSRLPGVILHLQKCRRRAPASTKYLNIDPCVQKKRRINYHVSHT